MISQKLTHKCVCSHPVHTSSNIPLHTLVITTIYHISGCVRIHSSCCCKNHGFEPNRQTATSIEVGVFYQRKPKLEWLLCTFRLCFLKLGAVLELLVCNCQLIQTCSWIWKIIVLTKYLNCFFVFVSWNKGKSLVIREVFLAFHVLFSGLISWWIWKMDLW